MELVNNNNVQDALIYQRLIKIGLIDQSYFSTKTQLSLTHDKNIKLSRINQFFFGTNNFTNKLNFVVLHRDYSVKKHMGEYWLNISKIDNYLNFVAETIKLDTHFNCCPYNYYKNMIGLDVPDHYIALIGALDCFRDYLKQLDTPESKTILNIMFPKTNKGTEHLETDIIGMLDFDNDKNFILKFNKKGAPLTIHMNTTNNIQPDNINTVCPVLRIANNLDSSEMLSLYDNICAILLMDTPECWLVNNLERVCGSKEFAELMVDSYLFKSQFKHEIGVLTSIIEWKDTKSKHRYVEYLCTRYPDCMQEDNEGNVYLNFEGVNKFFLNISEDDVENFDVKEQINTMYYNSMHELIHSFEILYKRKP